MSLNDFTIQDYLEDARGKVTQQFVDKLVFDKYLQLLLSELSELQLVMKDLMQLRSLDSATGAQLDNIGYIVGQPREVFNATLIYYFGFDGASGAQTFGDTTDPDVGGVWRHSSQPESGSRLLSDDEYRRAIKVKIIKNTSNCSFASVERAAIELFSLSSVNSDYVNIVDHHTIDIFKSSGWNNPVATNFPGLDEVEVGDRYLPIPLGVTVNYI